MKSKKNIFKKNKRKSNKKNIKRGGNLSFQYKHLIYEPTHYAISNKPTLVLVILVKITNTCWLRSRFAINVWLVDK